MIKFLEGFIYYFIMASPITALILWIVLGVKIFFLKNKIKKNKTLLILAVIFLFIGAYVLYQMQSYGPKRSQQIKTENKFAGAGQQCNNVCAPFIPNGLPGRYL